MFELACFFLSYSVFALCSILQAIDLSGMTGHLQKYKFCSSTGSINVVENRVLFGFNKGSNLPGMDVGGEFKGRRQAGIGSRNDLEKWTVEGAGTVGI